MQHATSYTYKLYVAYFIIPKVFWYSEAPCTTSTFCHLKTLLAVFQRCLPRRYSACFIVVRSITRARKSQSVPVNISLFAELRGSCETRHSTSPPPSFRFYSLRNQSPDRHRAFPPVIRTIATKKGERERTIKLERKIAMRCPFSPPSRFVSLFV